MDTTVNGFIRANIPMDKTATSSATSNETYSGQCIAFNILLVAKDATKDTGNIYGFLIFMVWQFSQTKPSAGTFLNIYPKSEDRLAEQLTHLIFITPRTRVRKAHPSEAVVFCLVICFKFEHTLGLCFLVF